jgi:hypothetical protein
LEAQKGAVEDKVWAARVSSPRKREGARKEKEVMHDDIISVCVWYFESERGYHLIVNARK